MSQLIRVLYVEDNPLDRELVCDALENKNTNFQVTTVVLSEDLKARLEEGVYDLVLSDLNILGFEGLQVLDIVHVKDPSLPVIIVTGTGSEEIAVEAMKRGAADYVLKSPKHIQRLPLTIYAALDKKRLEVEHEQAERALRESEERYRYLFEYSPIPHFVEDYSTVRQLFEDLKQQGVGDLRDYLKNHPEVVEECARQIKIVDVNKIAIKVYKAKSKEALLKDVSLVFLNASYLVLQEELINIVEGKTQFEWEAINQTLEGDRLTVSLHWSIVPGYETSLARVIVSIIDITERKRREVDMRHRLAELEVVNRISTALRSAQKLIEMLPLLLQETLSVIETNSGAIWLYDNLCRNLRSEVAQGWLEIFSGASIKPSKGIIGATFSTDEFCQSPEFIGIQCIPPLLDNRIPAGWGGACIPISTAQEVIGVFIVSVEQPRELSSGEIGLLVTLAEIAGNAIHRMRLHELTEQNLRRMTALRTLDQAIISIMDLRDTLEILITQIVIELRVDAALVLLLNPHTNMLEFAAGHGFRGTEITGLSLRLGEDFAGRAALERKSIQIPDLTQAKYTFTRPELTAKEGFVAYFGIPLIAKGQVKGVLEVFLRSQFEASADWLEFLEMLAGQAAIAIDNATLFEELKRSNKELIRAYETTLKGWSRALDLRDKETEGHTLRVTGMTLSLAQSLSVEKEDLVHIKRGSLLHDIGKMGIPDSILLKPSPLTPEEWEIMQRHPTYAYELLSPIDYLIKALDIPYCHHEKWDGTGYPRGLKGKQIPLAARIFAVVDVWDAITSDRPYREAWPKEKAIEHLQTESGKYFDPRVVELFLQLVS